MPAATFDTLHFANRLKDAGVSPVQAEAHTQAWADAFASSSAELATKADLRALRDELEPRFVGIERRLDRIEQRLDRIDQRFEMIDQRFDLLDQRFATIDHHFASIDHRFASIDHRFASIDHRFASIDDKFRTMQWMLGLLISGMAALLVRAFV